MNAGKFWFTLPKPYVTHEPTLGFGSRVEPVFIISVAAPCSLANFLVADPNLKQVVSRTIEAGVRTQLHPFPDATLSSDLAFYRTTLDDDILAVSSPLGGPTMIIMEVPCALSSPKTFTS